jgi:hypothetical protein
VIEMLKRTGEETTWEVVWLELSSAFLSVYTIATSRNIPILHFNMKDSRIIKLPQEREFELTDETNRETFRGGDHESVRYWVNAIKVAKLKFWQQNRPVLSATQSVVNTSDSRKERRESFFFDLSAFNKQPPKPTTVEGPPANQPDAAIAGYLMKAEKDKKTWTRVWCIIHDQKLWTYKSSKVSCFHNKTQFTFP